MQFGVDRRIMTRATGGMPHRDRPAVQHAEISFQSLETVLHCPIRERPNELVRLGEKHNSTEVWTGNERVERLSIEGLLRRSRAEGRLSPR